MIAGALHSFHFQRWRSTGISREREREREKKSIVGVEIYDGNRDTYTVGLVSIAWKEEEEGIIIKGGKRIGPTTHTHTLCLFLYKERDPTI